MSNPHSLNFSVNNNTPFFMSQRKSNHTIKGVIDDKKSSELALFKSTINVEEQQQLLPFSNENNNIEYYDHLGMTASFTENESPKPEVRRNIIMQSKIKLTLNKDNSSKENIKWYNSNEVIFYFETTFSRKKACDVGTEKYSVKYINIMNTIETQNSSNFMNVKAQTLKVQTKDNAEET